jgi:hypothetical protein
MLSKLTELIEGGFLAQSLLVMMVWGGICFLAVSQKPIPDPLLDAGFVIVGFYFRSAIVQSSKTIPPTIP